MRYVALLAFALGCSTYGVVGDRGSPSGTQPTCLQAQPSALYQPLSACTGPTPAQIDLPPRTPVCDHGIWTQSCRRDPDCPGGLGCGGALCRELCGGAPGDCTACGFTCVDGLCVP